MRLDLQGNQHLVGGSARGWTPRWVWNHSLAAFSTLLEALRAPFWEAWAAQPVLGQEQRELA